MGNYISRFSRRRDSSRFARPASRNFEMDLTRLSSSFLWVKALFLFYVHLFLTAITAFFLHYLLWGINESAEIWSGMPRKQVSGVLFLHFLVYDPHEKCWTGKRNFQMSAILCNEEGCNLLIFNKTQNNPKLIVFGFLWNFTCFCFLNWHKMFFYYNRQAKNSTNAK